MQENRDTANQFIYIVLALFVVVLLCTNAISGTTVFALGIVSGVFLQMGLIRFCPLYVPFDISTCN